MKRAIGIICTCLAILAVGTYRPQGGGTLPHCAHEYTSGVMPCVWDSQTDGVQGPIRPAARYMILVPAGQPCPPVRLDYVCRTAD